MKLPQLKMSTKLGGVLVLVSEVMFIFSIFNFLMISRLNYYSSDDTYIKAVFPEYLHFLGSMLLCGLLGMAFAYMIIIPSKHKFNQEQAVKDGRSPTYRKIIELEDKIDALSKEIKHK